MHWRKLNLNMFPEFQCYVGYWIDVSNANICREHALAKSLPVPENVVSVFLDAEHIIDLVQLEVAVTQALLHNHADCMVTRDLATEVIYCLSPTRTLTRALSTFSVQPTTKHLLVLLVDLRKIERTTTCDAYVALETSIQGTPSDPDSLMQLDETRRTLLHNLYGITAPEVDLINKSRNPHESLRDSILTRMGVRDLCRV